MSSPSELRSPAQTIIGLFYTKYTVVDNVLQHMSSPSELRRPLSCPKHAVLPIGSLKTAFSSNERPTVAPPSHPSTRSLNPALVATSMETPVLTPSYRGDCKNIIKLRWRIRREGRVLAARRLIDVLVLWTLFALWMWLTALCICCGYRAGFRPSYACNYVSPRDRPWHCRRDTSP